MIRAIDGKPVELSDDEFKYYNNIIQEFGEKVFQDAFDVEDNQESAYYGFISLVKPSMSRSLPMVVIFFLMNCMLNQRVREFEKTIEDVKKKLK